MARYFDGLGDRLLRFPKLQSWILWVALLWWLAVLGYGYVVWLQQGCQPFMPFISDMGLRAHVPKVFMLGTMMEGMLLGFWHVLATIARSHVLKALRLRFRELEVLSAMSGVGPAVGTFFIGLFPWDVYSYWHFACASAIFWGGCFYAFITCLLCVGISCDYPLNSLGPSSHWRQMHIWVTPLCCLCFLGVFVCLSAAYDARPDFFTWTWWADIQRAARDDFSGYCSGVLEVLFEADVERLRR